MLGVPRRHSITDDFFPEFFDLIVWGHEHESKKQYEEVAQTGVNILQPGSTVATSLIKAESYQKHSYQLSIYKKNFKIDPTPLKNTRPILYNQIELRKSAIDPERTDLVEKYLLKQVKKLLEECDLESKPDYFKTPLVRLKIEYTGYEVIKSRSILKPLIGKVANPIDTLQWFKKKQYEPTEKEKSSKDNIFDENYDENFARMVDHKDTQRFQIEKYMTEIALKKKMENIIGIREFLNIIDTHSGKDIKEFFENEVFQPILRAVRQQVIPELSLKQTENSDSSDEDDVDIYLKVREKRKIILVNSLNNFIYSSEKQYS